jgi:hypothetical protein
MLSRVGYRPRKVSLRRAKLTAFLDGRPEFNLPSLATSIELPALRPGEAPIWEAAGQRELSNVDGAALIEHIDAVERAWRAPATDPRGARIEWTQPGEEDAELAMPIDTGF